jgi:HSP20 family protein
MANIQRWDPFSGLTSMHTQLDDLFNNLLSDGSRPALATMPAMDVYTQDDNQLVTEVQAPGYAKEDIEVSVHDGVLEIKGEKRTNNQGDQGGEGAGKQGKRNYMLRESHASFYRSIRLPRHADADKVTADFENGVLKVTVPFKELPQPTKVTINSGAKSAGNKK